VNSEDADGRIGLIDGPNGLDNQSDSDQNDSQ